MRSLFEVAGILLQRSPARTSARGDQRAWLPSQLDAAIAKLSGISKGTSTFWNNLSSFCTIVTHALSPLDTRN